MFTLALFDFEFIFYLNLHLFKLKLANGFKMETLIGETTPSRANNWWLRCMAELKYIQKIHAIYNLPLIVVLKYRQM